MIVDLPTPPLPEPTQTTLETCASAPSGSAAAAELLLQAGLLLVGEHVEGDAHVVHAVQRADRAGATAVSKWLRIGQPGVVSETVTSTVPSARASIERTMLELDDRSRAARGR